MSNKLPYPAHLQKMYPRGMTPEKRRIKQCSDPKYWYAKQVGKVITVHYFATFGAWDTEGRWVFYYDLSEPIGNEFSPAEPSKKSFFKRLFS